MKNCLEIKDLCKSYGDFALDHVNLTIPGGTIMGLIGENGAGKTTTIKCILNLIRRDSGTITILGKDNVADERAAKLEVGVVLDECFFHDSLRPKDLKRILGPVYPTWDDNLYADYLKKFKLPEEKLIKEFSRGMKMKLSLAAALAHQPRLLILDEATAGLDPVGTESILSNIRAYHKAQNATIIMVSHSMEEMARTVDRLVVVNDGKIALEGAPSQVFQHGQELEDMGLGIPQMTRVFNRLKAMGVDVGSSVYTVEQAKRAILDALAKKGVG